jgi:hypothetical protein
MTPIVSRSYNCKGNLIEDEVVVRLPKSEWEALECQPEYAIFYKWVADNAPHIVDLCPYKFPECSERSSMSYEREISSLSKSLDDECKNSNRLAELLAAADLEISRLQEELETARFRRKGLSKP